MDRINKFLEKRQVKNQKNIKYKNKKYTITKEDIKLIRAYKSSKCLDSALKSIPNRILDNTEIEPVKIEKSDKSEYFNKKIISKLNKYPIKKVIKSEVNEIRDIWEDENIDNLKNYVQEWVYSINKPYEGMIENLRFSKEDLEVELKRVYMNYFRPRDTKSKLIREILPQLPDVEELRPFPEYSSYKYIMQGKSFLYSNILCSIIDKTVIIRDLKYDTIVYKEEFTEEINKAFVSKEKVLVCSDHKIYYLENFKNINNIPNNIENSSSDNNIHNNIHNNIENSSTDNKICRECVKFVNVVESKNKIKDMALENIMMSHITGKCICIHKDFKEHKILKLKGDIPHKVKIIDDIIYASTHKGIVREWEEKTENKNIGYIVDFVEKNKFLYALSNQGKLIILDPFLKVVGNVSQQLLGFSIKIHPIFDLLAILYSTEIGIYKIDKNNCIPVNTIEGTFLNLDWDLQMPWLYASTKREVHLFT